MAGGSDNPPGQAFARREREIIVTISRISRRGLFHSLCEVVYNELAERNPRNPTSRTIAREEIFGPVISILPYADESKSIRLANDTIYGRAAYVQSGDLGHARRVAAEMRAGNVFVNYPVGDAAAPFGGYKQSGNGREYGKWALDEFCEVKAVLGYEAA